MIYRMELSNAARQLSLSLGGSEELAISNLFAKVWLSNMIGHVSERTSVAESTCNLMQ